MQILGKFTLGVWKLSDLTTDILAGKELETICEMNPYIKDLEANARLIAAAPELYHMVAHLLDYVREWKAVSSGTVYKATVGRDISKAEELLARIDGKEDSHER